MSIRFLHPELANWFLAIPLIFVFWLVYQWTKGSFRHRTAIGPHLRSISRLSTSARDAAVLIAAVVAAGMLVLAVMRPQLLLETQIPEYEKHDLIVMLDRSVSMYAQDIKPSRFARALDEIRAFLARKPDTIDRVALVGFAGTSLVLAQLTSDPTSLLFYLDWMGADNQQYWGTDIGAALNSALQVTQKDERKTPKIFVVLSDGEDTGGTLAASLSALQQQGLRAHTIGIGGPADVAIPVMEDGRWTFLRDENDQVMTTRFSPVTLTNVARQTGGRYYRSVTGRELTAAIQNIITFERRLIGWKASIEYRDVYRQALMLAVFATSFLLLKL